MITDDSSGTSEEESLGEVQEEIVGGHSAMTGEWPFMVEVRKSTAANTGTAGHWCGGTLVHPKFVLTARHCVSAASPSKITGALVEASARRVFPGRSQLDDATAGITPTRIIDNPSQGVGNVDLVLLELPNKVAGLPTMRLASEGMMRNTWVGERSGVLGWGSTTDVISTIPNYLEEGFTAFLGTGTQCQSGLTANDVCHGGDLSWPMICKGDSGGPGMIRREARWYQDGVTSRTYCLTAGSGPGIFTRVATQNSWITSQLPQNEGFATLWSVNSTSLVANQQAFSGYSSHWDKIVPGDFNADGRDDLLFYRASAPSTIAIYTAGANGALTLQYSGGLNQLPTHIITGNFLPHTGDEILLYDAKTGEYRMYNGQPIPGQDLWFQQQVVGAWGPGAEQIVPGNFNNQGSEDLFFYWSKLGTGSLCNSDGAGSIGCSTVSGLSKDWETIVPGNFNGDVYTDLFFYDGGNGGNGSGNISSTNGFGGLTTLWSGGGLSPDWTEIQPLEVGLSRTALFFYAQNSGLTVIAQINANGSLGAQTTLPALNRFWSDIIPMRVNNAQSLMFYSQWGIY